MPISKHGERLLSGVRELVRTENTTLEDLHLIITDLVVLLDKKALQASKKLKKGQEIKVYDENSKKEYGAKGADFRCYFDNSYETKTGLMLKVYDDKSNKWSVSVDCLLDIFDSFDPESDEGKKRIKKSTPKKRGRKPKKQELGEDGLDDQFSSVMFDSMGEIEFEYEQEISGNEQVIDFEEWKDFYTDDD